MRLLLVSSGFFSLRLALSTTLLACMLSGCGTRQARIAPVTEVNYVQEYIMYVEGVECKLCAQAVIDLIKKIPGVSRARYHTTDDTYQESYITYMFDERMPKIEEEQLNAALLKEGFSLIKCERCSRPFSVL